MEQIKQANTVAYQWLIERDLKHWSKAFFSGYPICDMLLNNLCETFNSTMYKTRDKLIITLCETIRRYLARRIEAKRVEGNKWKFGVWPRIRKFLQKTKLEAIDHHVEYFGDHTFEIRTTRGDQFVVDLAHNYYACCKWELYRLPCSHAMIGILNRGLNPENYVHAMYSKKAFDNTYSLIIHPFNGPNLWETSGERKITPPTMKLQPEWPRKNRGLGSDEVRDPKIDVVRMRRSRVSMKCALCRLEGQNKVGCPKKQKVSKNQATTDAHSNTSQQGPEIRPTTTKTKPIPDPPTTQPPARHKHQVKDQQYIPPWQVTRSNVSTNKKSYFVPSIAMAAARNIQTATRKAKGKKKMD